MKITSALLIATLTLTGCAGAQYKPLVDTKDVDMNVYAQDLKECQAYAGEVAGAGTQAAAGAAIGAVLSAIIIGLAGGNRHQTGQAAAIGGVVGATHGGVRGELSQHNVVKRCMDGRGYKVLR